MSDLRLPAVNLSVLTALVYATGFVVVNAHLSAFSPIGFDLLRGRYLAAGLVYSMVIGPAVGLAFLGLLTTRHALTHPNRSVGLRRILAAANVAACLLCIAVLPGLLLDTITVDETWSISSLALCLVLPCLIAVMVPMGWAAEVRFNREDPLPQSVYTYAGIGMMLFSLTQSASIFGQDLYPRVSPSFGGGASWAAEVRMSPALVVKSDTVFIAHAAVFDLSDDYVSLLLCPIRSGSLVTPVTIPRSRVEAILLDPGEVYAIDRNSSSLDFC